MAAQKFRVYLDMDGVLADFFGEWARLDGKDHYKDIDNPEAKLELVRQHPTFWVDLPLLPHARQLVQHVIKEFGEYYIFLTEPPTRKLSFTGYGRLFLILFFFNCGFNFFYESVQTCFCVFVKFQVA